MSAQAPKLAKLTDRFGCETHSVSYLHAHAIRKFLNHLVQVFDGARTECIEAHRRPPAANDDQPYHELSHFGTTAPAARYHPPPCPCRPASFCRLPSPAERPPSGPDWVHKIKHDEYRLMPRRDLWRRD